MSGSNFSDFLLGVGADDDLAVVDGSGRHSYRELRTVVAGVASELRRQGVARGARVAVIGPNSFFWVAAYLAAMRVATVVPLSDKLIATDLTAQLDWVDCSVVIADRRTLRRLGAAVGPRLTMTDDVLSTADVGVADTVVGDPQTDAALLFTSGTTSRPKAVRITHENLRANTDSIVSYLDLRRSDRMLVILPFHYCFGASLLHTHLAVGGSVVLCGTFAFPESALDQIDQEFCTGMAGVPSTFQLLLRASSYGKRPLRSLRLVQQAGGRLPPATMKELAAAQPDSQLFVMYGQTEATARLSYLPPGRLQDKLGSIGKGVPGVDLAVLDAHDKPVLPGQRGEIVAHGANISPGYLNDPEATDRKFRGGCLRTGDIATVDDEGFIFIVGRSEDFIKSWGHRISPQQIEEAVLEHPSVMDAAVVGLPDAQAGERIVLAIVGEHVTPPSQSDVLTFLGGRLAKHMIPHVVVTLDALPLNSSGKVSRPELRTLLQNFGGAHVD